MKIKNVHILSTQKDHVVLIQSHGVLQLPGTQLKVSHKSKEGAIKDFMQIVASDLGDTHAKIKEKNVKKLLSSFKTDLVSAHKDLVLSSKKEKACVAANAIANQLFPGEVVYVKTADLKKGVLSANTQYNGLFLGKEARDAIQKAIHNKHI
jgi:hypothetical protein